MEKSNFSFKKIIASKFFSLFLILVLVAIGYSVSRISQKKKGFDNEISGLKQNVKKEIEKKEELERKLSDLENPETILKEARERFNLTKEGENVAIVINKPNFQNSPINSDVTSRADGSTAEEIIKETSNFKNWKNYFFPESR